MTVDLNECMMEDAEEDSEETPAPATVLTIELAKGKSVAVFHASIEDDALIVDRVGLRGASNTGEDVYFTDAGILAEELQDGINAYLADHGVDADFVDFIQGFVADKVLFIFIFYVYLPLLTLAGVVGRSTTSTSTC